MSLILCSMIIQKEMYYIRHADTGVNRENVLLVHFDNHFRHYPAFKREVEALPGVVKTATANYSLYSAYVGLLVTPKAPAKPFMLAGLYVDNNFIDLLGLQWKQRPGLNDFYDGKHIVLNEQAATSLGLQGNPVGQTVNVNDNQVVSGVLRDFNFEALRGKIGPLCLIAGRDTDSTWGNGMGGCLMSRVQAHVNLPTLLASMRKIYGSYDRMNPFDYLVPRRDFRQSIQSGRPAGGASGDFHRDHDHHRLPGIIRVGHVCRRTAVERDRYPKSAWRFRWFHRRVAVARFFAAGIACCRYRFAGGVVDHAPVAAGFCLPDRIFLVGFPLAGGALLLVALGTVLFRALGAARMNPVSNLRSE